MSRFSIRTAAALLGLAVLPAVVAQQAEAQKIGIMGGANFETLSDLQGGTVQAFDARTGYHFGVFVSVGAGPVGVRPALLYLNAGSLFEGASFLTGSDFDLSYLALPVDLKVSPLPLMYLFAGPEFQFLLSANAQPDFEDDLKSVVAKGGLGLGFQVSRLFLEGRYLFGLSGITSDSYEVGGFSVTGAEQVSNTVRVSAGISF